MMQIVGLWLLGLCSSVFTARCIGDNSLKETVKYTVMIQVSITLIMVVSYILTV